MAELARLHGLGVRGLRWNMVGQRHADASRKRLMHAGPLALLEAAHALGWLPGVAHRSRPVCTSCRPGCLRSCPGALVLDHFRQAGGRCAGRCADAGLACARLARAEGGSMSAS
ncbi:hypothetical protein ACU4GD_25640 [Cupriavidus basilensis]